MNRLELKLPPALVTLIFGLLMWGAKRLTPEWDVANPFLNLARVSLGLLAVVVCVLALWELGKGGTTADPRKPAQTSMLIESGVYRFSRNPIYLGLLLILIGIGPPSSNLAALLITPLFVLYMNRFQIVPEERALRSRFGDRYGRYCRRVRRWL